ncbi:hypothetical protein F5B22DRAFT_583886 [Xylaria bambusicola]|uniref:uncharacterized protein n=1 Tax=Xylaria bambusicola TaxID=326684 RepID=UPI00200740C2|nr:uncharacterized protein F5B22DRAFT_583886 [Xylaria bambusicola]KAI0528160.1 hypothetical protein F5B22DRAFT_583886 [Xylaria bambusicola]
MNHYPPGPPRPFIPFSQTSTLPVMNAFTWPLPEEIRNQIREVVWDSLFHGTDVKRDEMGDRVTFSAGFISFDEKLRPHLVFPAFWTPETPTYPLISIRPVPVESRDWDRCCGEIRAAIPGDIDRQLACILLGNGDHSHLQGPEYIKSGDRMVRMGRNPDIEGLLYTRTRLLDEWHPPMTPLQYFWLHRVKPVIFGMWHAGLMSQHAILDYLHKN